MNKNGNVVPLYRIGTSDGPQGHETVVFRDGDEQWTSAIAGTLDATSNVGMSNDVSLQSFMSRPVQIANYVWDPTSVSYYFQTFNPWTLFFGNKRVINRINNYKNMHAKLKVKIVVNGNPFYYGRLMAEYFVWNQTDQLTNRTGLEQNLVMASQRLKIFIDPTTNQGGELHLPMILQNNAFDIPTANWSEQGIINLRQVAQLKHANGATEPINIVVYAWAEDVKLSIPTITNSSALVFQSGEYGSKPISNLMSNVAKMAGSLSDIPWLSPYAKATQMVSSGIGKVASLFGYSRPAQIENSMLVKRNYMGNLSNTDRGDTCTRLTLDSKQELTLDPLTVGVSACDEMAITYIIGKETYITSFPWTSLNSINTCLFNVRISPHMARQIGGVAMFNSGMATVANLFTYWRGSLEFRFQIIASQYHKGRLLFVYDPLDGSVATTPEQNVQYTRIVDIGDERDFTMKVCWGQDRSYLPLQTTCIYANEFTNGVALTSTAWSNGFLKVYVLNDLTSPNSSVNNDISIAVYVKGGDDMEFNLMSDKIENTTYLPLVFQSGVINGNEFQFQSGSLQPQDKAEETVDEIGLNAPLNESVKECVADELSLDHTNDVFFGESVTSVRQLMKRYALSSEYILQNALSAAGVRWNRINDFDFPRYRGYSTQAADAVTAGNANIVKTTVMNYITPCYMGYRGSMRSKYIANTGSNIASSFKMLIGRMNTNTGGYFRSTGEQLVPSNLNAVYRAFMDSINLSGLMGTEYVGPDIQPALEVELPFYSNKRFHHTKQIVSPNNGDYNISKHTIETHSFVGTTNLQTLRRYVSVGEDFQLFLYQGQPPLYSISTFTSA